MGSIVTNWFREGGGRETEREREREREGEGGRERETEREREREGGRERCMSKAHMYCMLDCLS